MSRYRSLLSFYMDCLTVVERQDWYLPMTKQDRYRSLLSFYMDCLTVVERQDWYLPMTKQQYK